MDVYVRDCGDLLLPLVHDVEFVVSEVEGDTGL